MPEIDRVQEVIAGVVKNPGYASIDRNLVRKFAENELAKGRSVKEAVKLTRAKLHQVGGAYQEKAIPYQSLFAALQTLPRDPFARESIDFSRQAMAKHRSTEERLSIMADMYREVFAVLPAIHTILDLACGLNPLALPWMTLPDLRQYWAVDIYGDMLSFLQAYFDHMQLPGKTEIGDLTTHILEQEVDLAILLKTIPCLEQIEKNIGKQLLEKVHSKFMLVSYPAKSLSGRHKGMPEFYTSQFERLCEGKNWKIQQWRYESELVFLIEKLDNKLS